MSADGRIMFENCMRRLDDYHYVQCTSTILTSARCSCNLHMIKSSIRMNYNALDAELARLRRIVAAAKAAVDVTMMSNAQIAALRDILKAEGEL